MTADLRHVVYANLRKNLRFLRRTTRSGDHWMKQRDLVDALALQGISGWHPQTVSQVENGSRGVDAAELVALSRIFRVTVDELLNADAGHDPRPSIGIYEQLTWP
ncbi:hypothetical protein NPS01_25400 [Nocardioides psychrotolerans]|uniref:Helix-turn-helix n=1 Tax=Nocardioides psychrotolerans TaxID=1005945 RepID=A0A1I3LNX9_9ACTN|nr:helix-turn-helix transcriptional regulator [Nocardioides psychrotolerans]GEP38877.1 hypothetical protein NPS01_25400 [Nocardioides psychrotolerans]SFI86479.1 Helix-turn-helix [Nocardioides psychrotolerans]